MILRQSFVVIFGLGLLCQTACSSSVADDAGDEGSGDGEGQGGQGGQAKEEPAVGGGRGAVADKTTGGTGGQVTTTSGGTGGNSVSGVGGGGGTGGTAVVGAGGHAVSGTGGSQGGAGGVASGGSIGGTALDAKLPPSGNFDLTKWKITLPDSKEVTELVGYQNPKWFFTDPTSAGMVFLSPNIGQTTANSSYTRSELREMLNAGAGTKALGNNWITSTSSASAKSMAGGVDGTMNALLRVDHASTTGDAAKVGRLVVGQIHGPETEVIRLYYHKRPDDQKGAIYFATDSLDNKSTWVDIIGGPSKLNPPNGIGLGQTWAYEIKVVGLDMTVTVTPMGTQPTVVTYKLPTGYNDQYLYFKAGVYNQNNTGTAEDHAKVTFFELKHVHP